MERERERCILYVLWLSSAWDLSAAPQIIRRAPSVGPFYYMNSYDYHHH